MTKGNDEAFTLGCAEGDVYSTGLTKREHFAALAMQARLSQYATVKSDAFDIPKIIAEDSCRIADALIAALNQTQGESK